MWRGLYIAASGMITETKHTDMIANNLANASTTGYKRDDMAVREFEPMLLRRINDHSADTDVTSFKGTRPKRCAPPARPSRPSPSASASASAPYGDACYGVG